MPNQTHLDMLNSLLADSFALYLKTKSFHWHISGPRFRDLHVLLDDQAAQLLATTDVIAERVRKQGGTTLSSIGDISRRQRIKDQDKTDLSADAMLRELLGDNETLVAALRDVKKAVDDAGDNATSGIVDHWSDEAEQRAWFLRETLAG